MDPGCPNCGNLTSAFEDNVEGPWQDIECPVKPMNTVAGPGEDVMPDY